MAGADGTGPIADRAVKDLLALQARLLARIRRLLTQLDTQRGSSRLERDLEALATATRVRQQVTAELLTRGFAEVVDVTSRAALDAAEDAALDGSIPASARSAIAAIVRGQTADIASSFGVAADEMRVAINAGLSSSGSLADLTDAVAERLGVATSRAQVAVDTAVMAAGRTALLTSAAATALPYVFVYTGPNDKKTRDFCRQLVGRAVTTSYMARLNNGAGLPVREFCGGYNCRHTWSPMLRAEANRERIEVYE